MLQTLFRVCDDCRFLDVAEEQSSLHGEVIVCYSCNQVKLVEMVVKIAYTKQLLLTVQIVYEIEYLEESVLPQS